MKVRVSDHALVRFIARTGIADLENLRAQLEFSLGRAAVAAQTLGSRDYSIVADGLEYRISEGVVVTVIKRPGGHG